MGIFVMQLFNNGYEKDWAEEEKQWFSMYKRAHIFKEICGHKREHLGCNTANTTVFSGLRNITTL